MVLDRFLDKESHSRRLPISLVVIVDQVTETVLVHREEEIMIKLEGDDELHLPDLLGDLRVPVRRFFE